ncbi:hypothetical protein Pint_16908 [Pistacia integerrima]|uniref:Uncharacterized protein n=1 Tax=Pistacia integerrima TaxID=434235 RepID=A0ACC0ZB47_9ROSI|nr:hypothetical protein Pint_16908 [Pistacia integerrima]
MGAWLKLNEDLLIQIIKQLTLYEDLSAFGLVCTSWLSVAVMEQLRFISKLTPWLILSPEKPTTYRQGFYSFLKNMTHQVMLLEAEGKCFSSRGWILTLSKPWHMVLLHPFSRRQIKLLNMTTKKCFESNRGHPIRFIKTYPNLPILHGESEEEDVLPILHANNNTSGDIDNDIDLENDMNG